MKRIWALLAIGVVAPAWSQNLTQILTQNEMPVGEGWSGFLDLIFLGQTLLTLITAAVLGAAISYHPRHVALADTLEEIEVRKVYILYSVIGAVVGIVVVAYGPLVGFVLFGIGGLIRFRTILTSANLTGRVIVVTLIGLCCGLDLPHVAILATAFTFVLIYVLESRVTYRVDVQALLPDRISDSAAAYRKVFEQQSWSVVTEKKSFTKQRITFLISGPRVADLEQLKAAIEAGISSELKGAVDWRSG